MKLLKAHYQILSNISDGGIEELQHIEKIGRVCYKSEGRITEDGESAKAFVRMLINNEHEAMIEHSSLSIKFTVDRGISHELVRHRIASFAQESTRYCNYSLDKFENSCSFIDIEPSVQYDKKLSKLNNADIDHILSVWMDAIQYAENKYFELVELGASPQFARSVLPNSTKTEITITANYREWRAFFKLRTAPAAHPQMREIVIPLLNELKTLIPVVFDDIEAGDD